VIDLVVDASHQPKHEERGQRRLGEAKQSRYLQSPIVDSLSGRSVVVHLPLVPR
jgi:hypothetical protein